MRLCRSHAHRIVLCADVGRTSCDGQSNFTGGRLYLFHTIWYYVSSHTDSRLHKYSRILYYASTDEVRGKLLYLICNCPQWFAFSAKLLQRNASRARGRRDRLRDDNGKR